MKNNKIELILTPIFCIFCIAFFLWLENGTNDSSKNTSHDNKNKAITTQNQIKESIDLGAEWFLNNQNESFLNYSYNIEKKEHPDKHQQLREMGALWSISQYAHFSQNQEYFDLSKKGFAFFKQYLKQNLENDFLYINITPEKIKLGYSAFMILVLLDIDHPKKDYYSEKLANGIIYQQDHDGRLKTFFYSDRDTGIDYYPGEALLAVMSLYEATQNQKYLDIVQKAFPYYANYWRENQNTAFVPWQSRAYYKFYQATQDKLVADFIFEMNDYMLSEHKPQTKCQNFQFERGITTAVFLEGVIQAHKLALNTNNEEKINCYKNFIQEATDLILSLQEKSANFGIEAKGGFKSKTSKTMRVDRNQHAIMALMEVYELNSKNTKLGFGYPKPSFK